MDFPQSFFKSAGESACYALQIAHVAGLARGLDWNPADALEIAVNKGFVDFNRADYSDPNNFFVRDPAGLMSALAGGKWEVRFEGADYEPKPGEYAVEFWAKAPGDAAIGRGHFDRPDYHTLQRSETTRVGRCYSKRIFKRIDK